MTEMTLHVLVHVTCNSSALFPPLDASGWSLEADYVTSDTQPGLLVLDAG